MASVESLVGAALMTLLVMVLEVRHTIGEDAFGAFTASSIFMTLQEQTGTDFQCY